MAGSSSNEKRASPWTTHEGGLSFPAVNRPSRLSAALVLALYVGGGLALLFHLATEDHFASQGPQTASWQKPPCHHGHTPHSASDHEADQTTDEPRVASFDELTTASAPVLFAPPLALDLDL